MKLEANELKCILRYINVQITSALTMLVNVLISSYSHQCEFTRIFVDDYFNKLELLYRIFN